jgi:hypothetical protein
VLRAGLGELVLSARERTLKRGKRVLLFRLAFRLASTQLVKLLRERCRVLLPLVARLFGVARCFLRGFCLSLGLVHRFLRSLLLRVVHGLLAHAIGARRLVCSTTLSLELRDACCELCAAPLSLRALLPRFTSLLVY